MHDEKDPVFPKSPNPSDLDSPCAEPADLLSPDERKRLEAHIKKMTDEIMNEPFFACLERVGKSIMTRMQGVNSDVSRVVTRAWPSGSLPGMVIKTCDEIFERVRDIEDRVQRLGLLATRSPEGLKAVSEMQPPEMSVPAEDAPRAAPEDAEGPASCGESASPPKLEVLR